jgi:Tol biopolymer transport system component
MNTKYPKSNLIAISFLIISFLLVSSCQIIRKPENLPITTIERGSELSSDLTKILLLFSKNIDEKSLIYITDLAEKQTDSFTIHMEVEDISLSPDGQYLVFSSVEWHNYDLVTKLFLYDRKIDAAQNIIDWSFDKTEYFINTPSFATHENQIIFHTTWKNAEYSSLMFVNPENGEIKTILRENNLLIGPQVSPDGKKIITLCGGLDKLKNLPGFMICIMDINGNNKHTLTQHGGSHGSFLFTPDSKKVVYTEVEALRLIEHLRGPYRRVYTIDIDGKNREKLIDFEGSIKAISPDGQDIILEGRPNKNYPHSIYIVDIDGQNLRHLTYFDEFLADWYPEEEN